MHLGRKLEHIFIEWKNKFTANYTRQELQIMHQHFMPPSTRKLFDLLIWADIEKCAPDSQKVREDISKSCHSFQTFCNKSMTFQVRFPEKVIFNKQVRLGLMKMDLYPILHILDVGTNFSVAKFIENENSKTIWETFVVEWVTTYTSYPDEMLTDQGSAFISQEWKGNCRKASIHLYHTGSESHNSLGQGENYHAMLRLIYNKVALTHSSMKKKLCLTVSIKSMNDTAGPNELVLSLLLFGSTPSIPGIVWYYPNQTEHQTAMETA